MQEGRQADTSQGRVDRGLKLDTEERKIVAYSWVDERYRRKQTDTYNGVDRKGFTTRYIRKAADFQLWKDRG